MRLRNQRLVAPHCAAAEDVVAWLGAVQAQDYAGAKWAVAQRMRRGSDAAVEAALQSGALHIVAYKDRHASFDPRIAASRSQALASPSIVMNGQLIGGWRRTLERDAVCIEAKPLVPLTRAERAQLREAGDDYGRFLGMSVRWTGE
jgi:hypothetical protein